MFRRLKEEPGPPEGWAPRGTIMQSGTQVPLLAGELELMIHASPHTLWLGPTGALRSSALSGSFLPYFHQCGAGGVGGGSKV